jgi:predicted nucleotidyltransferase
MPTALELSPDGWKRYLEAARRRPPPAELTPEEQSDRERLLLRVRQAAGSLKARFGIRRVVLFGSLAHAAWFAPDSDVDLAVEGLRSDDFWQAWRAAEDAIIDRQVDLIEIETTGESLRRSIERYGIEL